MGTAPIRSAAAVLGLSGVLTGLPWVWPDVASAKPLECPPDHPGRHHAYHPWLFGTKAGPLTVVAPETADRERETFVAGVAGVFLERTLIHSWLEIEVSVPIAVGSGEKAPLFVPLDLHLKKPFHPSPRASPYVAVGPTMDILIRPERRVFAGVSLAAGTYVWFSERIGMDLEVDYNVVVEGGAPVHELLFALGPVVRLGGS